MLGMFGVFGVLGVFGISGVFGVFGDFLPFFGCCKRPSEKQSSVRGRRSRLVSSQVSEEASFLTRSRVKALLLSLRC